MKFIKKIKNTKLPALLILVVLVVISLLVLSATSNKYDKPADLIGYTHAHNLKPKNIYPSGWEIVFEDGFGGRPVIFSGIINKNNNQKALLLKSTLHESYKKVIDAIELRVEPNDDTQFSRICYFGERTQQKARTSKIIAEVQFHGTCARSTQDIKRAWRINLDTSKFEPVTDTRNLTCEFGVISLGEPDFRDACEQ